MPIIRKNNELNKDNLYLREERDQLERLKKKDLIFLSED